MQNGKNAIRKILLLNPPFDGLYIRDMWCSHLSKGAYFRQPVDLLMLSGRLHADGYEVAVVDAIAEGLSPEKAQRRVQQFAPDALIFLTGVDSFAGDVAFVAEAKRRGVKLAIIIGDVVRDDGEKLLEEHPVLDACLTDYVTHGVHAFLQGDLERAVNLIVRTPAGPRKVPAPPQARFFTLPAPRYDLFPLRRYRMPYDRYNPYAAVLTSDWCPYKCTFCPLARSPYRARDVEDLLENLEVVRRLRIRQVHFPDYTFGVNRKQAVGIVEGMIARKFGFTWSCLSRVDVIDHGLMKLMKRAGCDLIEFGIESGNQAMLDRYLKETTIEQIRRAFASANRLGISTIGTFVLGLPGETRETMQETLDLVLEIEPTFCSFNVASPRPAANLRQELIAQGVYNPEETVVLDSSRSVPVFSTETLSADDVYRFRQRAIRRFYLRPSYILRRLSRLASVEELTNHIRNGLSLAWQSLVGDAAAKDGP
jgi:radical SAM superfamily enzyme YgiQ (UPF0313 family)